MKKSSAVPDIRHTLDGFLVLAYRRVVEAAHADSIVVEEIARALTIPEELAVKVATFLEAEGLIDYDNQAVDVTIPGMLRAEALLRGDADASSRPAVKIAIAPGRTVARKRG